ncbi:MAG: PAS domain-containing protein [Rubrobacteraceae bacterium]
MGIAFRDDDARKGSEEQAQKFETWYRGLVERVPAVLYVDASDEINSAIYVSPQVEGMLGYAPHEWLDDPELWVKTLHPDDRQRVMNGAARTRETGETFCMEYRLVARDGRVVWVRDEATPVYGEEGRPLTWQGVLLDITERKRYEKELRRSEERHRLVARATGEAIWDNDLLTGKQEWAGATEALFGYPEYAGRTGAWWEERIHPEDRERVLSSLEAVYEGDEEAWAEEYRFRKADGSYAVVVDRGYIVRDGSGKPVRMVGSIRDITERKGMEDALKESEDRFQMTFEAAAVGMARILPDGRWREVNGHVCEILGYERQEI